MEMKIEEILDIIEKYDKGFMDRIGWGSAVSLAEEIKKLCQ